MSTSILGVDFKGQVAETSCLRFDHLKFYVTVTVHVKSKNVFCARVLWIILASWGIRVCDLDILASRIFLLIDDSFSTSHSLARKAFRLFWMIGSKCSSIVAALGSWESIAEAQVHIAISGVNSLIVIFQWRQIPHNQVALI